MVINFNFCILWSYISLSSLEASLSLPMNPSPWPWITSIIMYLLHGYIHCSQNSLWFLLSLSTPRMDKREFFWPSSIKEKWSSELSGPWIPTYRQQTREERVGHTRIERRKSDVRLGLLRNLLFFCIIVVPTLICIRLSRRIRLLVWMTNV